MARKTRSPGDPAAVKQRAEMRTERDHSSEAWIQWEILRAWGAHPKLRLWRQNVGALRNEQGRLVRFGIPGAPDILGLIAPTGRLLGIEVKRADGVQSDDQKRFERVITQWGGLYVLAHSLSEVDAALAAIGVTR